MALRSKDGLSNIEIISLWPGLIHPSPWHSLRWCKATCRAVQHVCTCPSPNLLLLTNTDLWRQAYGDCQKMVDLHGINSEAACKPDCKPWLPLVNPRCFNYYDGCIYGCVLIWMLMTVWDLQVVYMMLKTVVNWFVTLHRNACRNCPQIMEMCRHHSFSLDPVCLSIRELADIFHDIHSNRREYVLK